MRFDILTLFPQIFDSYFAASILRRATDEGRIFIEAHNIRAATTDKHNTADDKPYGGGAGMVMMALPILESVHGVIKQTPDCTRRKVIIMSAKGKQFNQRIAATWAKRHDQLIIISGRYEGIDERVKTVLKAEEISIGPYVLTDGDVAGMAIVSAVARLVPGVIKLASLEEETHWNLLLKKEVDGATKGLEYPHYTRPEVLEWRGKKYRVPKILLSGDHKKIAEWRRKHMR